MPNRRGDLLRCKEFLGIETNLWLKKSDYAKFATSNVLEGKRCLEGRIGYLSSLR
jgi:hypothetical protein